MNYIRIVDDTLKKASMIPITTHPLDAISTKEKAHYSSMFYFNKEQMEQFQKTQSVAGITNVKTNKLWWDFDATDLNVAKSSTQKLIERLIKDKHFKEENIQVKFSGAKGFHVVVDIDKELTPSTVKSICTNLAEDLPGFDPVVYNATRILRIPCTKHEKTGLYSRPLTLDQLNALDVEGILNLAKSIEDINIDNYKQYYTPGHLGEVTEIKKEEPRQTLKFDLKELDFNKKPSFLDNARWALQNGFFRGSETKNNGDRSWALLCLASTYRNLGFDEAHTSKLLEGVIELQAARTGETPFSDKELDYKIIRQVYGPHWRGGQFSIYDKDSQLYRYALEYGVPIDEPKTNDSMSPITVGGLSSGFIDFAVNAERNTIKTGLAAIDKYMPIMIGSNNAVLGASGSGKTTLLFQIAEHTSKDNVPSVVASIDMTRNRVFHKLAMKEANKTFMEVIQIFKNPESVEAKKIVDAISAKYKNVYFYDKAYATVADLKEYIKIIEKQTGIKIKLVMIDYFERLNSNIQSPTESSMKVAGEVQDMVNEMNLASITFVQPNKFSLGGGPDKPLLSYTAIKGSSFLYQSFRQILSLWRPFYTPELEEYDHYMQMAILKNDLGELKMFDYGWDGKTSTIRELEDIERKELKDLLQMKAEKSSEKKDPW